MNEGEWTEQTVNDLIYKGSRGIADAHNAAIVAAIAAEQKPLVEMLELLVRVYGRGYEQGATIKEAKALLAKARKQ